MAREDTRPRKPLQVTANPLVLDEESPLLIKHSFNGVGDPQLENVGRGISGDQKLSQAQIL